MASVPAVPGDARHPRPIRKRCHTHMDTVGQLHRSIVGTVLRISLGYATLVAVSEVAVHIVGQSVTELTEWLVARIAAGTAAPPSVIDCSVGPRLRDRGCGLLAWRLAGSGCSVRAVDLVGDDSLRSLHPARDVQVCPGSAPVRFQTAATHRLAEPGTSADCVVAVGALSRFGPSDAARILREAARLTAAAPRGGRVLVVEPAAPWTGARAAGLWLALAWTDGVAAAASRWRWLQGAELEQGIRASGLAHCGCGVVEHGPFVVHELAPAAAEHRRPAQAAAA
eukprot:TRINITY_DN57827_c0_g1_i1.p2 TRINITY_DN57827_c0_g1~~TRINITY_DN57827_c0_g1_i1.p2  ORF type:complete len:282 (+),score=23.93 TRINITY_DN57827_c0_g1_i1:82-927(+)